MLKSSTITEVSYRLGTRILHTCTSYLIPEIHGGAREFACVLRSFLPQ